MIAEEACSNGGHASDSLLWLKRYNILINLFNLHCQAQRTIQIIFFVDNYFRGLHFVYLFLQSLVLDHENSVSNENLLENVRTSYDLALRPYHNWGLQKLFMVIYAQRLMLLKKGRNNRSTN